MQKRWFTGTLSMAHGPHTRRWVFCTAALPLRPKRGPLG